MSLLDLNWYSDHRDVPSGSQCSQRLRRVHSGDERYWALAKIEALLYVDLVC